MDRDYSSLARTVREDYEDIFIILAPPRSSSTALARVFWEQPSVGYYLHEPFDLTYHKDAGLDEVLAAFHNPIELGDSGKGLVIKEMTFQVGDYFRFLVELTRNPIVFIISDPRSSSWSRMMKRRQGGQDSVFPEKESGWDDLQRQILDCKTSGVPYSLLDSTSFRNRPESVLPELFEKLGLPYSSEMLHWDQRGDLNLGNLGDEQKHWYQRVLESTELQPSKSTPPSIDVFPEELRPGLEKSLSTYQRILADEHLISP